MAIIAPPSTGSSNEGSVKKSNYYLKDALISKMKEVVKGPDGQMQLAAQAMADRLLGIALYAENNLDALNAMRLIYERTEGKAAIAKVESTKETPRVIFALDDTNIEKLNEAIKLDEVLDTQETDVEPKVLIETDDGKEFLS